MTAHEEFAQYPSLRDRVVLITGGATGIGAAMVEQFALQGSKVGFVDLAANDAQELIERLKGQCAHTPLFLSCDLTDIPALRNTCGDGRPSWRCPHSSK